MSEIILWGFDASTYVRTVKMVLAEKCEIAPNNDPVSSQP